MKSPRSACTTDSVPATALLPPLQHHALALHWTHRAVPPASPNEPRPANPKLTPAPHRPAVASSGGSCACSSAASAARTGGCAEQIRRASAGKTVRSSALRGPALTAPYACRPATISGARVACRGHAWNSSASCTGRDTVRRDASRDTLVTLHKRGCPLHAPQHCVSRYHAAADLHLDIVQARVSLHEPQHCGSRYHAAADLCSYIMQARVFIA